MLECGTLRRITPTHTLFFGGDQKCSFSGNMTRGKVCMVPFSRLGWHTYNSSVSFCFWEGVSFDDVGRSFGERV